MVTEPSGTPPPSLRAARRIPVRPPTRFAEVSEAAGLSLIKAREEQVGETYLQRLIPIRLNRRGPALAVGDISENGRDDVALGGTTLDPLRILASTGPGRFKAVDSAALFSSVAADDGPILLFDASGRGHADLLVTRGKHAPSERAGVPAEALP